MFQQPTSPANNSEVDTLQPSPFIATWNHASGLACQAVEVRLVFPFSSTIAQTSGTIIAAPNIADGNDASISWANTGFTDLAWGTVYSVEMRGQDTGGTWSDWSTGSLFATNSAPAIPSQLSPANGTITTIRPTLTCVCEDTGLHPVTPTVTALIRTAGSSVPVTRTMSRVGDHYAYTTTSSDLPSHDDYRWNAYSFDGTLYSGGSTSVGGIVTSPSATFTYAAGPTVTITSPADSAVLTQSLFTVAWTSSNPQSSARVEVFDDAGGAGNSVYLAFPQGEVTTWTVSDPQIGNGFTGSVKVTSADTNLLVGEDTNDFSVSYTPPATLTNPTATTVALGYDPEDTAVRLDWDASVDADFVRYEVGATPLTGPSGTVDGPRRVLGTIRDVTTTTFLDAEGASGTTYQYDVRQVTQQSGEELLSDAATVEAGVTFRGVVLGSVTDPEGYHANLRIPADPGEEGEWESEAAVEYVQPFGGTAPVAQPGSARTWNPSGAFRLFTDATATSAQKYQAVQDLHDQRGSITYRTGRGDVRTVFLDSVEVAYRSLRHYIVELAFREVARSSEPLELLTVAGEGGFGEDGFGQ